MDDLMQELQEELDFLTGSTPAQRRAMYRLGHSKWYVKRHCRTKQQSSRQIGHDVENYETLHPVTQNVTADTQ